MLSALITADSFRGYLAISRSIFFSASGLSMGLPVDLAKHNVLRPYDRHGVGDHVPLCHLVERRQVREPRGADLQSVRLVGAVATEIDAEPPLPGPRRHPRLPFPPAHALAGQLYRSDPLS